MAVVLTSLVGILDDDRYGGAGGFALEHTAKDPEGIFFLSLGRYPRLAGAAAIKLGLYKFLID
jgi:hypothetical protein